MPTSSLKSLKISIVLQKLELLVSQAVEHRVIQQEVIHLFHVNVVVSQLWYHCIYL